MPGGRWDPNQSLNPVSHQVEWPTGPLSVVSGTELPTYLEAWVVQRSTGASQGTAQTAFPKFASPGTWTANTPVWRNGSFQAGPALGIALVASHDSATNTDAFFWWVDEIELR